MEIKDIRQNAAQIKENIEKVIIGHGREIDLILSALLAGGHVLIEDAPGTGKTMLAKALAKTFACEFRRVQFTPDLLPSDLTGINYYSPKTGEFTFRKGSLFSDILLADEINRATPRTQSGLLESMEERQITVDGETYPLSRNYFVIATQNPIETQGTFPLPEAQLDRFLMQISLGYPDTSEGTDIIKRFTQSGMADKPPADPLAELRPVCTGDELGEMRQLVRMVFLHDDVCRYITQLAEKTRAHEAVALGVSPRGGIALARVSQSYAAIQGRDFATPDDVKYLTPYVFAHRIMVRSGGRARDARVKAVVAEALSQVTAPTENWRTRA